jgi:hypothetical protein
VGLNFENPEDKSAVSTVTFGYWDYGEIFGGEDGLNWYPNTATSHWGVIMDDVQYNNQDIQGTVGGKLALIDSGNTSIQIPESEFKQLKSYLQYHDVTLHEEKVDEQIILVSRQECKTLYNVYGDLKFMLHKT